MKAQQFHECKHCKKPTKQFLLMDLKYTQRRYEYNQYSSRTTRLADNDVEIKNSPVFLCEECCQNYVNISSNNSKYTRKDALFPMLINLAIFIALMICALIDAPIIILRLALCVVIIIASIVNIVKKWQYQPEENPISDFEKNTNEMRTSIHKYKRVFFFLIQCGVGISMFFLWETLILNIFAIIILITLFYHIRCSYDYVRGHHDTRYGESAIRDAAVYYFRIDDNINLL